MAIAEEPDTRDLTAARLRRMSGSGGVPAPSVDPAGLPPGPRWPVLVQSAALMRFRHWFHPYLHRRYGDAFTVRIIPGGRPLVLLTRPDQIREVFTADPEVFHAGKGNAILGPVMGEHSLLLSDGEEHHRARRLLTPAFSGQALRGYQGLVAGLARDEAAHWRPGVTFSSLARMNALTLEVILRVVFGVTDADRLAALRPRVRATVEVGPLVLLGWGYPWLQRFGPWRRTVENQVALDRLIYAEIRERRADPDLAQRTDVLSGLVRAGADGPASERLDDTELRDQLVTLLLAGHETTASALAWALYELGRDRALLRRTQEAADAASSGEEAERTAAREWLEAVVKESMRLHPVIPVVVRTLTRPATVAGYDLPAGATVGPSIVVSHQRGEAFPDPEVFRPERFVGATPPPHTWIPFGGGVRRCIGAGFALMEGVEALREVLTVWDVEAVGADRPRVRNITSVPREGARIRVRPRR